MRFVAIGSALALVATASAPLLAQQTNDAHKANDSRSGDSAQGASDSQKGKGTQAHGASKQKQSEPVVLTVTTVAFAESTGCWAKLYDGENFSGRTLTLMGAQQLPNLEFGGSNDWEGDIDSVQVGPKAKLVLYDDENYQDDKREIAASAKIADLHKALFDEGIESLTLSCTGDAAR